MFDVLGAAKIANGNNVSVYMDKAILLKDISQLMTLKLEGIQIVKLVDAECPWYKKYKTIDMKLDVFGIMEDQFYARVPQLI